MIDKFWQLFFQNDCQPADSFYEMKMIYARDMETEIADQFVGMYVNDYTLDYGESGRNGVRELLRRGYEAGLITQPVDIEFVQI